MSLKRGASGEDLKMKANIEFSEDTTIEVELDEDYIHLGHLDLDHVKAWLLDHGLKAKCIVQWKKRED